MRANVAALTRGSGEVYVIGAGKRTTVNQVYRSLVAVSGIEPVVTHAPRRAGDVRDVYFNAAKAARELGWTADVDVTDGMRETFAYFRERSLTAPA